MNHTTHPHSGLGAFADQSEDTDGAVEIIDDAEETETNDEFSVEIPDDLSGISADDLAALRAKGEEIFDLLRPEAEQTGDDSIVEALASLTEGLSRIDEEIAARDEVKKANVARVAELARKIKRDAEEAAETEVEDAADATEGDDDEALSGEVVEAAPERPKTININLSGLRQPDTGASREEVEQAPMSSNQLVAADGTPGLTAGSALDIDKLADVLSTRMEGVAESQYVEAARSGKRIQTQVPAALIKRNVPDEFRVSQRSDSQGVIEAAISHWMSDFSAGDVAGQHRSLTASAWCAPSTVLYDICEIESTDGLINLPGIGVSRGGVMNTVGPDFSQIFADTGFCFTSAELDEQSPPGSGPKPCFTVECNEFVDNRAGVCGTCIRAGLLMNRAYPELVQRTIRGAITAHAHRTAGKHIEAMVAGSDAVTMPAGVGGTATLLGAIELQVEHFRYINRASRTTLLEAVLPFYARGIIREDLSRRLGVDLLAVTDGQISDWFALRGVRAQFVYNFDDLTGGAAEATEWPDTVRFLLYSPGTWVAGTDEVIRIDTLFDSALLAENDFTALFLEEALLTVKTCPDSRIVSVPVCVDGHTAGGIAVDCDGAAADAG